jgi:hypothetical protein
MLSPMHTVRTDSPGDWRTSSLAYHDQSHLSDAANKTVCSRGPSLSPPIADVRHEFPPGNAHRPAGGDAETLVGNKYV